MQLLRKFGRLALMVSLLSIILSEGVLAQSPPPRPVPDQGQSSDNNSSGDSDDGVILGDIYGQVIDKSTGLPGAGLTVVINDIPIRTDSSGKFSLTGIADGTYFVDLNLPADFVPAQTTQQVDIINRSRADIVLEYYSTYAVEDQVEATVEAAFENKAPEALPESGGDLSRSTRSLNIIAVLFMVGGLMSLVGQIRRIVC